ncbi:ATP/GTP-binding protein [Curtobacterium sp. VKM Ac-1395]|uniref:ATP/GTP-binding protein n=1 Tax=Curtobacterium sp. VKM Ac-1395 TaxID=2783815 RepID=UPI001E5F248E|nr:ATP/GTP-binding protein [Curtobacterium sp. VKM Ac-1395]
MPAIEKGTRRVQKKRAKALTPVAAMAKADTKKKLTKKERQALKAAGQSFKRPGARGWIGRGRGETVVVQPAPEWRGTTVQVCGLWPYAVGAGSPISGVPLGLHLDTGSTVCGDPISWFQSGIISNPSIFALGLPGLGKSTLIRRMCVGGDGMGYLPLVLGDLKPDYVDMVRALDGQVITLGRGRGHLNILDPGGAIEAAEQLRVAGFEEQRQQLIADAHGRRNTMVSSLLTILRKQPPNDVEESIIDAGLRVLDDEFQGIPVLSDLLEVIQSAHPALRDVAVDRGSMERYQEITRGLEASLISLSRGGRLGEIFSQQTDVDMKRDKPVVYDVSSIDESDTDLQAAVLLACWSQGFGTVNVATALADAKLQPRRHYLIVMDELWRALRVGKGIVDRIDSLTRLNRQRGVGLAMITHTMSDLMALPDEQDRMKARGFVERAGMIVAGGLPRAEMSMLTQAVALSRSEQNLVMSWQNPPGWSPEQQPPGRGKFLIKVGGHPGIPVHVELTEEERFINDTNKAWHATESFPEPDETVGLAQDIGVVSDDPALEEGAA